MTKIVQGVNHSCLDGLYLSKNCLTAKIGRIEFEAYVFLQN